jgi:hypothetical protein
LPDRPASLTALLKPFLTDATGLPLNSTKLRPAAHVGEQPWRHGRRRLPFFGGPFPDRLAIKDPAVEIHERATFFLVRRSGGDRAGAGAGIDPDQDKPRDVAQRPLVGGNRLALC